MLKFLLCGLLLLSENVLAKLYETYVEYNSDITPSCVIRIDDGYWKWRDSLGPSENIGRDLSKVYEHYLQLVGKLVAKLPNEEAMCSASFLMSPELAKIFNYFGNNVSPISFYYQIIQRLKDLSPDCQNRTLTVDELGVLIKSSIKEIESRFLEEEEL